MKALIFNSGIGKRMKELTQNNPKSMVHLYNDETIFERQIRLLQEAGITEVVITTGPYPEMLKNICNKSCYRNMHFVFPHNEIFDASNYIYSMYKAREYLDDDILMMHGDLVFDRTLIPNLLKNKEPNTCLINKFKPLPEKDFKGRIIDNELREVGINIFDSDCYAFQPLYKLSKKVIKVWLDNVIRFVENKNINVYAENAFNEVSKGLGIRPVSYHNHFIDEVDNKDDLTRVNKEIEMWDYKTQIIKTSTEYLLPLKTRLKKLNSVKPFIVVDRFLSEEIKKKVPNAVIFSNFTSNPKYEEMLEGLKLFKESGCDSIISIGGGSCIDVAKVIRLSINADLNSETPTFKQPYKYTDIKHICIPTTSGTGSESTKHAVLYLNGVKQSIANPINIPDYVILCPKLIVSVPEYQKKVTIMDALCQCIESLWSRKATKESRKYARSGLKLFKDNYKGYLENDREAIKNIQLAANYSGKAINISETTAAHAMSYKITSLYNIPHGHAVAICMNSIFNNCKTKTIFGDIDAKELFYDISSYFNLFTHIDINANELQLLVKSVNPERLKNFPYRINVKECYKFCSR
ncbi:MAG: iron-containing alcohol dehydrogenase [Bacilli bacterium]|nr:iron-containing alcohol dehydrogenase [Bacilli bacterium]